MILLQFFLKVPVEFQSKKQESNKKVQLTFGLLINSMTRSVRPCGAPAAVAPSGCRLTTNMKSSRHPPNVTTFLYSYVFRGFWKDNRWNIVLIFYAKCFKMKQNSVLACSKTELLALQLAITTEEGFDAKILVTSTVVIAIYRENRKENLY